MQLRLSWDVPFCLLDVSLTPKQLQCIGLLASGMSQKDIAESLQMSTKSIQRWMKEPEFIYALESSQVRQESPHKSAQVAAEVVRDTLSRRDELRAKEVALLDNLQEKLFNSIESDGCGYRVVSLLIKISERRSKLLGLEIRNLSTLDAVEKLLQEEILSTGQAAVIFHGVEAIERNLRVIEDQKESRGEIEAIKNLSPEQLAQEYKSLINESY
ncbi:hypothetical protein H6G96_37440 [Nostoc sp. FACHB-892]|uniref:LuxR C-terminal-related transcriptional regulator n=1 Tax=Nostoc sp. FACHB-892 TaxID=2692843 RepID=UPI001687DC58|nr:LuxR C-terminal-related transcriptional regulator [Nostoc sp. FACHB-892]MBD2731809.1 hypothetical protein [Nostoc sp. FACHB-892]